MAPSAAQMFTNIGQFRSTAVFPPALPSFENDWVYNLKKDPHALLEPSNHLVMLLVQRTL